MTSKISPVKIRIRNFQSIDDLEIEVKGFTCISGKSNIGKSAIMRAVSRSFLNRPVTGMVRKGSKFTTVEISSAGWGFKWEKGESGVNRYVIDGKTYDKTGQTQIPEVEAMGFGSIKVGDEWMQPWWAPQLEPMFLLNKSGPQVTSFISEVSRLQVYQNAIQLSARRKQRSADEAKLKQKELERIQDKLVRIDSLSTLERVEAELEDQLRSAQEYGERVVKLRSLQEGLENHAEAIRRVKSALDTRVRSAGLEELAERAVALARAWTDLERTAKKIIALRPADAVRVPSLPEAEYQRAKELSELVPMVKVKVFVARAEKAVKAKVPDPSELDGELSRVKELQTLAKDIAASKSRLSKLEDLPSLPADLSEELDKVRKIAALAAEMKELEDSIAGHEADIQKVLMEKKRLEDSIADIPTCGECGRPVEASHEHTKKRKALSA